MAHSQRIEQYLEGLPQDRKVAMQELRKIINKKLPDGFTEVFGYGMIAYVIPHTMYPSGYHCDPKQPLPFISIASQKSHIALYHMGLYADPQLYDWFTSEYPNYSKTKLDMGKSCIRFKKPDQIPFQLVSELCTKMSASEWIALYEQSIKK